MREREEWGGRGAATLNGSGAAGLTLGVEPRTAGTATSAPHSDSLSQRSKAGRASSLPEIPLGRLLLTAKLSRVVTSLSERPDGDAAARDRQGTGSGVGTQFPAKN